MSVPVTPSRERPTGAACLRRCFGRQARFDAATGANSEELGFSGSPVC
jgi:hypothetical protein